MPRRPFTTAQDQSATFVELFFDLVFVFALTQVVSLLAHDLTWSGVGHALLVFWLVWWGWTQYTWALNTADTTHPGIEAGVLAATGLAFLMAVVIPQAFDPGVPSFAFAYVVVRSVGLVLYARVTWEDAASRRALWRFAAPSMSGLAAVIVGAYAPPDMRVWWWTGAIVLDLLAATIGGNDDAWDIRPEHFGERHGLFVIIALGESLIVAAIGLTGAERTGAVIAVAVLSVAIACGLWWSYFVVVKPLMDAAMEGTGAAARPMLARDAYSITHFPLIFGVVLLAVGIEEAIAHPSDPLPTAAAVALGSGVALFVGASTVALRRGGYPWRISRMLALGAMGAGLWWSTEANAPWSLASITVVLAVLALIERPRVASD